jgi:two-component system, NarL family, nitrate/nitrite response regulator NarL
MGTDQSAKSTEAASAVASGEPILTLDPSMPKRITVVVADDSQLFCSSIARAVGSRPQLELLGRATDGEAALELIKRLEPDVAAVDVRMPGLDGEQLLNRVARDGLRTRIVLLSAHIDGALVDRALRAGAAGCLSKDDSSSAILDAIAASASGHTSVSPSLQTLLGDHLHALSKSPGVRLSPREHQVLELSSQGRSADQVASELFLSPETVNTLLQRAGRKLGARGKTHAVAEAIRRGLL